MGKLSNLTQDMQRRGESCDLDPSRRPGKDNLLTHCPARPREQAEPPEVPHHPQASPQPHHPRERPGPHPRSSLSIS